VVKLSSNTKKNIPAKERALVLQGGGSLGAYEAGAYKALYKWLSKQDKSEGKDTSMTFDNIAGTSIGAMNAAVLTSYVFDSLEQYELESNNFLHRFAELISDYRSYESKTWKVSPYSILDEHKIAERKARVYGIIKSIEKHEDNLRDKLQMIVESLVKFFDAKFARIWLVDKERKYLILKFSAGKYRNTQGEFSKVPMDSLKIGAIAKTGRPIITNGVVHDSRIKHPDWAKKEKLRSFAGYPLTYEGKVVGVMAMFSEKQLLPADFELLGIFCDKVSKELSAAYDAQEYLAIR
jgi:hypothetical protein